MNIFPAFHTPIFLKECNLNLEKIKNQVNLFSKQNLYENRSGVGSKQYQNFECIDLTEEIKLSIPTNDLSDVQINEMWININPRGSSNSRHHHNPFSGKALSGVFYVQATDDSGDIVFYDPRGIIKNAPDMKYFNGESTDLRFSPRNNSLIIFPAWLEHSVEENISAADRISISFNISLRG